MEAWTRETAELREGWTQVGTLHWPIIQHNVDLTRPHSSPYIYGQRKSLCLSTDWRSSGRQLRLMSGREGYKWEPANTVDSANTYI